MSKTSIVRKVKILDVRYIPFLNRIGPTYVPVAVSDEIYQNLVKLGFNMEVVEEITEDSKGRPVATSEEEFEAADDGVVQTGDVSDVPAIVVEGEEVAELPTGVVTQPEVTQKSTEEVPETSSENEATEFELADYAVYEAMSRQELVAFVNTIPAEFLTEEQQAAIANKRTQTGTLLEIVKSLYADAE